MRPPLPLLLACLALAACTHGGRDGETDGPVVGSSIRSGEVTLAQESAAIAGPFVVADLVHELPGRDEPLRLAAPVAAGLVATLSPVAVLDAGASRLVYNSWGEDRPALRMYDLAEDSDAVLVAGASSVALRRDGALAYLKGPDAPFGDPDRYRGHVVVGGPGGERAWTVVPGRYVVAAWARERLLVYRLGDGWPELIVLDGPDGARVLAEASGLVALSPDGRRAVVSSYGASPALVRVLELADGREVARLELAEVEWVSESGSWVEDVVAAPASPGIVVFRVGDDELELEQVLSFRSRALPAPVSEPRLGDDARSVAAWGELPARPGQPLPDAVVVACDRVELSCALGPTFPSPDGPRPVYNPSRP